MFGRCLKKLLAIAIFGSLAATRTAQADPKIVLAPAMVTNENLYGDAGALVNEQGAVDDPGNGAPGTAPSSDWVATMGFNAIAYPASAFIDLGVEHQISKICLYDSTGSGDLVVSRGVPFSWTPVLTEPLTGYNSWKTHNVNFSTRYLRFTFASANGRMPEVVLYGTATGTPTPTPVPTATPTPRPLPLMEQFLGTNAFFDDPVEKAAAVGVVREYHNWRWNESDTLTYPNNLKLFNPNSFGGRFDDYYSAMKGAGITVSPCIQDSILPLVGGDANKIAGKPILPGSDPLLPSSYIVHADAMYQFAARYGFTKVPDANLRVAAGQPRTSGARLVSYFENWNEPDKNWKGRDGNFTPYELAAMSSADYDGHRGAMGTTFGVKQADPTAKFVMGGLAFPKAGYLSLMKLWADYNRGGQFPADVINVHHYSNNGADQTSGTVGISPEDDNLKGKMAALVAWRDANVPAAEFWLSEFGYDVNPGSVQRAPAIGATTPEETQGRWLVRSYLALAAARVDKAMGYMLRDVDVNSATRFNSSGLVTKKGEWTPRPSWFYTYTFKNRLGKMRFVGEIASGDTNVLIYKFADSNGANCAYAVWCRTSNNTQIPNYQLQLPGNTTGAKRIDLVSGDTDGVETTLALTNYRATVTVSELPIFVTTTHPAWTAPSVSLTSPAAEAAFDAPASFSVDASVANNSRPITKVDFYQNGTLVGTDTTAPYNLPRSGLATGAYTFTARATDNIGALFNSAPLTISVRSGTGLKGQYFNGDNFNSLIATRTDPKIEFQFHGYGAGLPGSMTPGLFSIRWTGKIQAIETGSYRFDARFDDGIRVWISDGSADRLVIDRWTEGISTFYAQTGTHYMEAGKQYNIKVEYVQRSSTGQVKLEWLRPRQSAPEVIPQKQLYPAP